ncbi:hypothetical protein JX265_011481 [Neoarthrinium moseri]|uniref:Diaminohydroxyphosphoribosylamino-pyrimidine deaminase n=1 Tax=Neoarthrinium moseri TaxID=1658444 RepID=A0A9P9WCN6_9PEZI|nr:hypothetical protein JX266_001906 [Neoarthrinium moseri]KAI1856840.1 hypothetical protein JX265_011481 [Neoarthrinium moseri]
MDELHLTFGSEVEDPEEAMTEAFLLFSQEIPSQNLGFVDSRATTLELTVAGKDYVIHQSPTVLSSNRAGGTTGAVLWKVTPMFAEWIASPRNPLWKIGALGPSSNVIELGCGISGLTGLVLAPSVSRYVLTDQPYVSKFVESNLAENMSNMSSSAPGTRRKRKTPAAPSSKDNLRFASLDWELDEVTSDLTGSDDAKSFDVVVACDCIYNDALIRPLVETCVDVCKLRGSDSATQSPQTPAICIVAQQLRDPEIFEGWMKEFHKHFRTWRVPESALTEELRSNAGFVIHIGILR